MVVKEEYANLEAPKAKGEGVERANWPTAFKQDLVDIPAFQKYLHKHMAKKDATAGAILLGAGRALGSLETSSKEGQDPIAITDVRVLVGLYTTSQHQHLLDLPLLQPKYHWSAGVISGLVNYAQYHLRELTQRSIKGEAAPLAEYKMVLASLIDDLKGGHHKRHNAYKEQGVAQKARDDFQAIKQMPLVARLQEGVQDGYMTLRKIADKFEGQAAPPKISKRGCQCCNKWWYSF
jgi:hypothetical protein